MKTWKQFVEAMKAKGYIHKVDGQVQTLRHPNPKKRTYTGCTRYGDGSIYMHDIDLSVQKGWKVKDAFHYFDIKE